MRASQDAAPSFDDDGDDQGETPELGVAPDDDTGQQPETGRSSTRAFVAWGVGGYLVVTGVLVVASLVTTGGTFVYLIDDPAIHLSMARTLAESGTWGVVPGEFQSASSAPLWTLALSLVYRVAPWGAYYAPVVLNVVASIVLIVVLGQSQDVLRPSRRRPLDGLAVVVLVVAVLFLPALTLLGMEHVVHMALVVTIVTSLARCAHRKQPWPGWLPLVLLAAAALVRFETAFLAVGLAAATVIVRTPVPVRSRILRAGLLLGAAGLPMVAFAAMNKLAGQGWLPNSVLAKGQVVSGSQTSSIAPLQILNRLTSDPLLAFLVVVSLVIVVVGWGRMAVTVSALAFAVTSLLHVTFADVGWFERYQGYLIAFGVAVLLLAGTEAGVADRLASRGRRSYRPALITMTVVLLCATKVALTWQVPIGVADTYEQRYQAARFLDRFYDDQSIATGELGYISLMHEGPVTDMFGLGDFDVLELRRSHDQQVPPEEWERLARDRGFDVAAIYPMTLFWGAPDSWVFVGSWAMDRSTVTAFEREFQFWATSPEMVEPLRRQLLEFESELPDGVALHLDELAEYRADLLLEQGS